jgi:hypothetical protein
MVDEVLQGFPNQIALYGKTKIFLRNETFAIIESVYQEKIEKKNAAAFRIQGAFFRYKQMKKLRDMFKNLKKVYFYLKFMKKFFI